jgi:polyhydroxyalkanoate synthesis regulator protein
MDQTLVIKRYGRSRLYEPARGRYVSIEDLRRWQREGMSLMVLDVETGADVTRVLLA